MNSNSRTVRFLLGAIAVLLGVNLLVQVNHPGRTAQAAGLPDTGAQLQAVVDQLTELNKRVDKMQSYLESGKMTVEVKSDKDK